MLISRTRWLLLVAALLMVAGVACSSSEEEDPELAIGGIPDQDVSVLEERFNGLAEYLSEELDIPVTYRPSTSYSALVTAFEQGDVKLGWFGGLTGVQARLRSPGAEAIAQRPRDEQFHSVFIANTSVEAESLEDLRGKTFTFGSESSTSGHLMPRHFLTRAGIDPEEDFNGSPSFSGSHDRTWTLVESGSFQAGALNEAVWQRAVEEGQVDQSQVQVVMTTPAYYDYHWVAREDIDEVYGGGTVDRITEALLGMQMSDTEEQEILELFQAEGFINTSNDNYQIIEDIAREQGMIQ